MKACDVASLDRQVLARRLIAKSSTRLISFTERTGAPLSSSARANNAASQVYALQGQCFVLAPCATLSKEMIDLLIDRADKVPLLQEGGGFAMIYGPDGAPLCEPLPESEEGLLYADVDQGMIGVAKAAYDPVGHYSRPDVVRLLLNPHARTHVETFGGEPVVDAPGGKAVSTDETELPENASEN